MSLETKAAQLLLVAFHGTEADVDYGSNTALHGVGSPLELVTRRPAGGAGVGGVVHFNSPGGFDNVTDPTQLGNLGAQLGAADAPCGMGPIVSVDQEGGRVVRLTDRDGFVEFTSAERLGDLDDEGLTRDLARARARQAEALGINLVLAPVGDTDIANSRVLAPKGRSFSNDDPDLVARHVTSTIAGHSDAGVASAVKHFPNHGRVPGDTHLTAASLDVDRTTWDAVDSTPFRATISQADPLALIMTGHLSAPGLHPGAAQTPATLSPALTTGVLRNQLGFDGVIVTDDLFGMEGLAAVSPGERLIRALDAGADLLITTGGADEAVAAITGAVADGRLSERDDLDPSLGRVLALKRALGLDQPAPAFDRASFDAAFSAARALDTAIDARLAQ